MRNFPIPKEYTKRNVFVVIWTTTPWTIPANLAVAFHPDFKYVAVEVEGNEIFILAEELVENCMKTFGFSNYGIVAAIDPKSLEKLTCMHPIYDRESLMILADHVTLDAGTGVVHTAPGHGREDYEIGLHYGLEPFSPVDDEGLFTDEVDYFTGKFVFNANKDVNAKLSEAGALVAEEKITHSYPHCWRCKEPVIFRATPQWFISMDNTGLRQKTLEEIDRVQWIPHWGKERIYGMIENRPDWCISRQRAWGVPITVFYCESCDTILADESTAEHIYNQFKEYGADVWFEKRNHRPFAERRNM